MGIYVQYGCGLDAPENWLNLDASLNLRLQRLPLGRSIARALRQPIFPDNVRYGNIIRGLPLNSSVADCIYCSHVLEHFSLADLRIALRNTHKVMKQGAVFRLVTPDLEQLIGEYYLDGSYEASSNFLRKTGLGKEGRPYSLRSTIKNLSGTFGHLWLWDFKGLKMELESAGFVDIRRAEFNDSQYSQFREVENLGRWTECLGVECYRSN